MITGHLHRCSFLGPLLILATSIVNCSSVDAAPLPNKGPGALAGTPQVVCTDERITLKAKSVPLDTVLDSIAKACRLKILSPSAEKSKTMTTVDFNDVELSDALNEVLRGCDYLVVYNESIDNTGFDASVTQTRTPISQNSPAIETEPAVANDDPIPVVDEKQAQVDYLRDKIETISERIASGASDRFYQHALKHNRPEFIHNDRKILAQYQRQLTTLEQQRANWR